MLHFAGTDLGIYGEDLDPQLLADLLDCGTPGQAADDSVDYVMSNHVVSGDPDDCRSYLRGYGAWDDDDLQDHDTNLQRLVWLTGCGLRETQADGSMPGAYFSTY